MEPHELALSKAKIKIMDNKDLCFFAEVLLRLKYEWVEDPLKIDTGGVSDTTMYINTAFFMSLCPDRRQSFLIHEVKHITHMHGPRRLNRDKNLWNIAGDFRINQDIKNAKMAALWWVCQLTGQTMHWCQDDKYDGDQWTTEAIYDDIVEEMPPPPSGKKPKPFDDLLEPEGGFTEEKVKQMEANIQEIIMDAVVAATQQGNPGSIPDEIRIWIDSLLKPKLPMADHLRRFFKDVNQSSWTWTRPNRRYAAQGLYLPTRQGKQLCHICFAFDMSCSVSEEDIRRYLTEVHNVMVRLKPSKISILQFDTRVISVTTVKNVRELMGMELKGRGGTSIHPVMDWAKEEKPEALVVFSDGEFQMPFTNPKVPVLWMIHGRQRIHPAFGQVTMFEV